MTVPNDHLVGQAEVAPEDTLVRYLELWAGGQDGVLNLWTKQTKGHRSFDTHDLGAAARYALGAANQRQDIYVRANVQGANGGATADTVTAMTVVTLDFDVAGPGHKAENLPDSPNELEPLLTAADVNTPTVILQTGGGLLAVWALEEPITIRSEADRVRAADLSRRFQGKIAQAAKARGFRVDSTFDLVRACRLPGTTNWKEPYGPDGAPVTVWAWSGEKLPIADLERIAASCAETPKPVRQKVSGRVAPQADDIAQAKWPAILAGCDALRGWAATAEGLSEPEWYALAGVLAGCAGGRDVFHELSQEDSRYDPAVTDAKFDHAYTASPPRTCSNIEQLDAGCGKCPFRGRVHSPIALGFVEHPAVAALARRWVYVAAQDGFVDLADLGDVA